MIQFYNTLTRKKEEFQPLEKGKVKMYHCGPTVYGRPHIGNYRAFLFADLLRRTFEYLGFQVLQVMNLTDVDDKTIRGAREKGVTLQDFTRPFIQIFFEELEILKVKKAHYYPKATEHIEQMVRLVQELEKKGLTYRSSEGSIYFSIEKFQDYGKLSHIHLEGLQPGARVDQDEYDKSSPRDFALWKAWQEEDGDVYWETPLGKGRPGWHLECSAMSMEYLGSPFDIHTGGVDLIFPHHENEIAQSEGATGKPFARYWLHNEHFLLDGKKISKSEGNVVLLPDLLEKGYSGEVIRYALISAHYRTRFNLTLPQSLDSAKEAVRRLKDFRRAMARKEEPGSARQEVLDVLQECKTRFQKALEDDLNMPEALGSLFASIRKINSLEINREESQKVLELLENVDQVLGVIGKPDEETLEDDEILQLIEERKEARKRKDYQRADEIRDQLKERGIFLEDTPKGTVWKRIEKKS
ncbi:MAG: cysteine--tRNA ligase [Planctomycetota bacterium]|nr:MAG: cysteine--tRNA ligase [Planctomycetota bacterium]